METPSQTAFEEGLLQKTLLECVIVVAYSFAFRFLQNSFLEVGAVKGAVDLAVEVLVEVFVQMLGKDLFPIKIAKDSCRSFPLGLTWKLQKKREMHVAEQWPRTKPVEARFPGRVVAGWSDCHQLE